MSFQITALDIDQFNHLFSMTTEQLALLNILEATADKEGSYPCRVSLQDASIGEKLLLVNFEHLPVNTPYRSTYAIYLRRNAAKAVIPRGEVPGMMRSRLLSIRGIDKEGIVVNADVVEGDRLEGIVEDLFGTDTVEYLHIHFAKTGCYVARVDRLAY